METRGDPDDFMPTYDALPKDGALYKIIREVIHNLHNDKLIGKRLKQGQIPKYYSKKHDVNAVFKVDLPGYWRLVLWHYGNSWRETSSPNGGFRS